MSTHCIVVTLLVTIEKVIPTNSSLLYIAYSVTSIKWTWDLLLLLLLLKALNFCDYINGFFVDRKCTVHLPN